MSQLHLLSARRFWPLFWTQFLGAFNDNLFKNAIVILITYKAAKVWGLSPSQMVPLTGGIFILPFFLFSAISGQIADKYEKSFLIRWIKFAEVLIMCVGALGFWLNSPPLLLITLFFMGWQSTLFGPIKYSILPQLLKPDELVGGNALIEGGTFLSILIGTLLGGVMISIDGLGPMIVSGSILATAATGYWTSRKITRAEAVAPNLKIDWHPIRPTLAIFKMTRANRTVFLSILGISWFWFFGAAFLSLFPTYGKEILRGDEGVVTLFLALFSVGIGIGSMLCERFSDRKLELGLVPLGTFGMTLFAADLYFASAPALAMQTAPDALFTASQLFSHLWFWRIVIDLVLIAVSSGFFIVPLYTLVQERSDAEYRSRIIAGNNIVNAFFMVVAAVFLVFLAAVGLNATQIFLILALMNLAVAIYIYTVLPEFLFRLICWIVANLIYRLTTVGRLNIPAEGPAVLVCNHVGFVDWLVISSASPRPVRFVMDHGIFKTPLLGRIFRRAKVIPIATAKEDPEILEKAFDQIAKELRDGELVCIFPEGRLTPDGRIQPFKPGIEKIIRQTPVPVIPMALQGVWGSFFSRAHGKAMSRPLRRFWSRITLNVGQAIAPEKVSAPLLQASVTGLRGKIE